MRNVFLLTCLGISLYSFGQTNNNPAFFICHDTVILQPSQGNWLIPASLKSGDEKTGSPNTLGRCLLRAVAEGKLKAIDNVTGEQIPAGQIYTWRMPSDTVAYYDNPDIVKVTSYKVIQSVLSPEDIMRLRVQQDWYLDQQKGQIFSKVVWVDLMMQVYFPSGEFRGYRPYCRIFYP